MPILSPTAISRAAFSRSRSAAAVAAAVSPPGCISIGGSASGGGASGAVQVNASGSITTFGQNSGGILAQSIGGGGGNGGGSGGLVSIGGNGGKGGDGAAVTVTNSATIRTSGNFSDGLLAQSIGGGGGNGGLSLAVVAPVLGLGGNGGAAGNGGLVTVTNSGSIFTAGHDSSALVAEIDRRRRRQRRLCDRRGGVRLPCHRWKGRRGRRVAAMFASIQTVPATLLHRSPRRRSRRLVTVPVASLPSRSAAAAELAASRSRDPEAFLPARPSRSEARAVRAGPGATCSRGQMARSRQAARSSTGLDAESIGGGGGNGGFSIAATGGLTYGSIGFAMGGTGGAGSDAGTVTVANTSNIATTGDLSPGIFAHSIGGGGGNGGFSVAGAVAAGAAVALDISGSGAAGANGNSVDVSSIGNISTGSQFGTSGSESPGIFAQSVGGGGGNGGFAGSVAAGGYGGVSCPLQRAGVRAARAAR